MLGCRDCPSHTLHFVYVCCCYTDTATILSGFFEISSFRSGAAAYVISRAGMEEVLARFFHPDGTIRIPDMLSLYTVDLYILPRVPLALIASPALFTTDLGSPSTIGSSKTLHIDTQKRLWSDATRAFMGTTPLQAKHKRTGRAAGGRGGGTQGGPDDWEPIPQSAIPGSVPGLPRVSLVEYLDWGS